VQLIGRTGGDDAPPPSRGCVRLEEPHEPPLDEVGGEVLLGHRCFFAMPAFPNLHQYRAEDLQADIFDAIEGEGLTDDDIRGALIEVQQGGEQFFHERRRIARAAML